MSTQQDALATLLAGLKARDPMPATHETLAELALAERDQLRTKLTQACDQGMKHFTRAETLAAQVAQLRGALEWAKEFVNGVEICRDSISSDADAAEQAAVLADIETALSAVPTPVTVNQLVEASRELTALWDSRPIRDNELLDMLTLALPYIEDAERDPAYKPGAVAKLTSRIRALIESAS